MTDSSPSPTILSPREIKLHLGSLVVFIALLALWYWLSTGARAVPTLIEMLADDDPSTRIVAAEQLGLVGPAAGAAVPTLLTQATQDGSQHANTTAAAALKSIDLTAARLVMTHFIARLQDPDVQQRRTAGAVLGSLGAIAKPAVPPLLAVMNDSDELVRRNALTSLASIGIPPAPVAASLIAALHAPSSLVRHTAAAQFAFTTPVPQEAEGPLTSLLADQDRAIAGLARSALDKPRPDDVSHIRSLGLMVEQWTARDYALHQLAQLGPLAGQALPAVVPMLQDEHPLVRYLAAETLGAMGPIAQEALPFLRQELQDADPIVRASIAEALAAIDSGNKTSQEPGR
jgi:HEAT repeat protein